MTTAEIYQLGEVMACLSEKDRAELNRKIVSVLPAAEAKKYAEAQTWDWNY